MIGELLLTEAELEAGLAHIRRSPQDEGRLELIVRRPQEEVREVLAAGELTQEEGLAGDNWRTRGSSRTADGSAHPDMQLTLMNARMIALLAPDQADWPAAGDQLYVDLDLSQDNLPPGTQLAIGQAVIQVTNQPHTGCKKFAARFGVEAMKFINAPVGKSLQLRGINTKVIRPGAIAVGDVVRKIE